MTPTASTIYITRGCSYWTQPHIQANRTEASEAAKFGTSVHEAIERDDRTDRQTEPYVRAAYDYSSTLSEGYRGRKEVAFALDMVTGKGRELASTGKHRDYSDVTSEEIAGTADVVLMEHNRVHIVDWKTGRATQRACESDQLRLLAFAAMSAYGFDSAKITYVFLDGEGGYTTDSDDLLAWESDEWRAGVIEALAHNQRPHPGRHCKWCPGLLACPGIVRALTELDRLTRPESEEHALEIYRRLNAIRAVTSVAQAGLAAWVKEHGSLSLPDGTRYGYSTSSKESIDLSVQGALEVVTECLGSDAIEYSTSKAALGRAAAKLDGPKAPRVREVLEKLRAIGAVERRETVTLGEHQ